MFPRHYCLGDGWVAWKGEEGRILFHSEGGVFRLIAKCVAPSRFTLTWVLKPRILYNSCPLGNGIEQTIVFWYGCQSHASKVGPSSRINSGKNLWMNFQESDFDFPSLIPRTFTLGAFWMPFPQTFRSTQENVDGIIRLFFSSFHFALFNYRPYFLNACYDIRH